MPRNRNQKEIISDKVIELCEKLKEEKAKIEKTGSYPKKDNYPFVLILRETGSWLFYYYDDGAEKAAMTINLSERAHEAAASLDGPAQYPPPHVDDMIKLLTNCIKELDRCRELDLQRARGELPDTPEKLVSPWGNG